MVRARPATALERVKSATLLLHRGHQKRIECLVNAEAMHRETRCSLNDSQNFGIVADLRIRDQYQCLLPVPLIFPGRSQDVPQGQAISVCRLLNRSRPRSRKFMSDRGWGAAAVRQRR
jgi:hypothetical protein